MSSGKTCRECGTAIPADSPGGFCAQCLFGLGLESAGESVQGLKSKVQSQEPEVARPLTEKAGDRIGRYRLLQEIGHGGCGVVYMAEQEEPVRRKVALKVIKLGMDTRQVVARFEAERQALALMDHPNIAKILDAGITETPYPISDHPLPIGWGEGQGEETALLATRHSPLVTSAGRPYFVMELVGGIKITDYCDQNQLTTRQRLDLFIQVCRAIQHAHQKGIIHRDIKPSNVLVTTQDGTAVPKVYMSPEQAQLGGLDVDTRSDIYSLGVLLYELLTGKTPFDAKELLAAGLEEMRRTIREVEPVKPSTRRTQELTAADKVGRASPCAPPQQTVPPKSGAHGVPRPTTIPSTLNSQRLKELIHLLRGDLDWIVMKCLEKDRARRYETANGLARDIERHLSNEPVVAGPPSNFYRFQKLVRRNKLTFFAATSVAAALILGLGVSSRMYFKERQAHRRALAAEATQSALRREAETGRMQAEAHETALLYWQAFNAFPSLSDKEARTLVDGRGMTFGELAALAARFDEAFKLIRRGAKMQAGCDWLTDPALGPEMWLPTRISEVHKRTALQAAQVRARVALAQGRAPDACEDLLAAFILGRNIGVHGSLVSVMVQADYERRIVEFVGENFFRFTPEALATLVNGIESAPKRTNVSQAMDMEKTAFAGWIIGREQDLRVAAGGDEQKALAAISELLRYVQGEDAEKIIQAAGGTSAGVIAYTSDVMPFYDVMQSLATASPQNLAGVTERAAKLIEGNTNLLVSLILPNVGSARGREVETLTRLAMLRAAVAYRQRGIAGLNSVRDPFGEGPFELRRMESDAAGHGFELQSKLGRLGLNGVQMFKEQPIAH
ncbi:MAG: hypothetical protein DME22_04910 [Verrucomicrobia bacterium]|nr:MAG: hypothetical protein DME22_04910 [Verrucomicrobiota bacterium]